MTSSFPVEDWCEAQGISHVGVPSYEGSGSHCYKEERYRFLVIPRYGTDVGKIFISNGRRLPVNLINSLAIQMVIFQKKYILQSCTYLLISYSFQLHALEYIHSQGYAHADVKACNILLDVDNVEHIEPDLAEAKAYLVDYGLAYRFRTSDGAHKPFMHDERRAGEGTLIYTSRDAHHGSELLKRIFT